MVAFVREIQRVYARLEQLPQVTIAEIRGYEMELEASAALLASAQTQDRVRKFLEKNR